MDGRIEMHKKTVIYLRESFFTEKEKFFLETDGISVSFFRYESSVAAIRVKNRRGEIVILPYQGQQIWNCVFDGRDLTMKTAVSEPVRTYDYLTTYGGFLLHCGATAMGVPSNDDNHPLHGELPNAQYQEAYIITGEDGSGVYIIIGGRYRHNIAFNHNYIAEPAIKIRSDSTLLDIEMKITNNKKTEMDLMFMEHINFRPVENSVLCYSADYNLESVKVNVNIPKHIKTAASIEIFIDYLEKLRKNPELHHIINAEAMFDPEVVMNIVYKADETGYAHSMQIHPDGYADYVCHNIMQFDQALRWISRCPDQEAMGLVLPANSGNGGYIAEKKAGNVKSLAAGKTAVFNVKVGLLTPNETVKMENRIENITERK